MKTTDRQIEMKDSWIDPLAPEDGPAEKVKYPAALARTVVEELMPLIAPLCEIGEDAEGAPEIRIRVCGSLRRRKTMVGDVEFVFVPRMVCTSAEDRDLLEVVVKPARFEPMTHALLDALVERGVLTKRVKRNGALTGWGPWNRFATHVESGLPVDFFGCTPESFWNTVVCRTGGLRTNTRICDAAIAIGWHWEPSPEEAGFQRRVGLATERHAVRSEREVFDFVRLPYLEPWRRE